MDLHSANPVVIYMDKAAFIPACQLLQDGTMDNYIKLLQEHRVSHLVCATDQVRYYLALRTHAAVLLIDLAGD